MFKISSDDYMKMLKTKIKLLKRKTKDNSNDIGSHVSYEFFILPNYSTNILTAKLTATWMEITGLLLNSSQNGNL